MSARRPLRIGNISGFYGDRLSAAREMLEGGPIDVITGDYLAELTMLILWKARQKDPGAGYAVTFIRQMEEVLGACVDRGVRVIVNAGGLNPRGLAEKIRELAKRLGVNARVAHVEGDDLLPRLGELRRAGHTLAHLDDGRPFEAMPVRPVSANAYLGAWGIVECLKAGADVVVCPRVTDASLVVGPAAWHFDWARDDWDRLASAVVAGHVLECGAQATGGNSPSSARCPIWTTPASRSQRWKRTVRSSSPSTLAQAVSCQSVLLPPNCSTNSASRPTRIRTRSRASTASGSTRPAPIASACRACAASLRRARSRYASTTQAATATR